MALTTPIFRLHVEGVSKAYGRRVLCRDVSAQIVPGEVVAVIGPNGSGKTTFLNMIAGLTRADHGQIRHTTGDRDFLRPLWHRHMGYVSSEMSAYDELSGNENLEFVADTLGINDELSARDGLLEEMGLDGRGRDRVATYSSGMKHRLKICAALLRSPSLLILDEPSALLDEDGQTRLWRAIARRELAVVMATNSQDEASRASRQIRMGGHGSA